MNVATIVDVIVPGTSRALLLVATVGLLLAGCGGGSTRTFTIPSSAMEPTLHCGKPAPGCEGSADDKVVVESGSGNLARGDMVVFKAPPQATVKCGVGGTYIKRIIGKVTKIIHAE